jgi:SAM-dependent methyltransferase
MRRPEFIARQSSCPSGWLGRVIGHIMARETRAENAIALRLLGLRPNDAVLEIGFGHGRVIAEMARRCVEGKVCGLDSSATMLQMARDLNRETIANGTVTLDLGDSNALPYASASFDSVLSVHTIYFWKEPLTHLREVLRVLKPGGRFVLGYRPDSDRMRAAFPESVYTFRSVEQVRELMSTAGFQLEQQEPSGATSRDVVFSVGLR